MGIEKQIADEARMKTMGIMRYRAKLAEAEEKKRLSQVGAGVHVLAAVMPALTEKIKEVVAAEKSSRGGPKPQWLAPLKQLKPSVVALITLRTVLDLMAQRCKVTSMGNQLGGRIEDELRLTQFKKEDRVSYRNAMKQVENSQDYRYKHKVMIGLMSQCATVEQWKSWSGKKRLLVGTKLIDCLMKTTDWINMVEFEKAKIIVPSHELVEALKHRNSVLEELKPWYMPTTDVPRKWVSEEGGGYETLHLPLVKHVGTPNAQHSGKQPIVSPRLLNALNDIQETPWRVNRDVFEVLDLLWGTHAQLPQVPSREAEPQPERPAELPFDLKKEDMEPHQLEMLKAYKRARAQAIEAEIRRASQLLTVSQIRVTARELLDSERFYFPQQLDWRGRAYSVPLFLSPQGPDLARGLLEFAEGKPIGTDEAGKWFLITGATHFGEDKISFEDRVDWVDLNEDRILSVAADPLTDQWWMEASEPYQFLAWCIEYARWHDAGFDLGFRSHHVVGMDGSCNGLQHFSAMLRDERGGKAVNLVPGEKPRDIYQEVCDVVTEKLERIKRDWFIFGEYPDSDHVDVSDGEGDVMQRVGRMAALDAIARHSLEQSLARQWLRSGLLDRSVVKRQVMTLPYGATAHGMQSQLIGHLAKKRDELGGGALPFEDLWDAALFLTGIIHSSIGEVVVAAAEAMRWLQDVARLASAKGLPLRWRTPHGFIVKQAYRATRKVQVDTHICGRVQLNIREYQKAIDKRRQASGISPNFVHALDSCHMFETVAEMPGAHWALVHDSFGTHAADAPRLAETLRRTFVELYENHDVLAELKADLEADLRISLPDPPAKGTLDIRQVEDSFYFFA